jgi:stress response protein SCP2
MTEEVVIETKPNQMMELSKPRPSNVMVCAKWTLHEDVFVSLSCLLFDSKGILVDSSYFNHTRVDQGTVRYLHVDSSKADFMGFDDSISISLQRLSHKYKAMAFVISTKKSENLSAIKSLSISLSDLEHNLVYTLDPTTAFSSNNSDDKVYLVAILSRADYNSEMWKLFPMDSIIYGAKDFMSAIPSIHSSFIHHKILNEKAIAELRRNSRGVSMYFDTNRSKGVMVNDDVKTLAAVVTHPQTSISVISFNSSNYLIEELEISDLVAYSILDKSTDSYEDATTAHIHLNKVRGSMEVAFLVVLVTCKVGITAGETISVKLYDQSKAQELKEIVLPINEDITTERVVSTCKIVKNRVGWKINDELDCGGSSIKDLCRQESVQQIVTDAFVSMEVRVNEGRSLPAMDINGLSDPYFKIFIDEEVLFQSEIIKKTLNPKWRSEFKTTLRRKDVRKMYSFKVEVWDWDKYSSDDYIGEVVFDLDLRKRDEIEQKHKFYTLLRKSNKEAGSIQMDFSFKVEDEMQDQFKYIWGV